MSCYKFNPSSRFKTCKSIWWLILNMQHVFIVILGHTVSPWNYNAPRHYNATGFTSWSDMLVNWLWQIGYRFGDFCNVGQGFLEASSFYNFKSPLTTEAISFCTQTKLTQKVLSLWLSMLIGLPVPAPPVSMDFLIFSWSSQRSSEKPSKSVWDTSRARFQKQAKWCQWGTLPSNMGD